MSISFSGLSSGIDTSSWVESLVALRQAKVTKLEEEKESVVSIQDVLSNIKSFFTSFRSTIEKVTDAKFGIVSMDLFAQNLATSSNINVLTGTATTEAEEATYNIQVDKLASSTEAASNQNFTTTVIETATATLGTKLSDIGVKTGQIGVTSNGNQYKISITEEDSIKSLIDKLQAVGVDANYNEKTGIFSANIDASDIDDSISNTGIVDAFHLSDSVGGYGSGKLETSDTDTLVTTATGSTKLRMLGVEAGTLTMEANGAEYSFQVTDKTTIQEFVDAMKSVNIDASFNNGVLSIVDAEITDEGTTNIISALGLETKVNQNTQTSGGLSYTEVKTAGTIPFHQRVLHNETFLKGNYDTTFIDTKFDKEDLKRRQNNDPLVAVIAAAIKHFEQEKEAAARMTTVPLVGESLWKYYGKLQMTANNY